MKQVTITLSTNINGKLSSQAMLHIAPAPASGIPESKLNETEIIIHTKDNSHPPTKWMLVDTIDYLTLGELVSSLTWPSHGMHSWQFIDWYLHNYPGSTKQTKIYVYFYKKIP